MINKEKTLTPRQAERREAVVQSVRFHLEEYGFDGLSMRKVAQEAGVSPSTLYEIYGSKESLILYAIKDSLFNLAVEEDQYEPGLERFLHRLESIAHMFEDLPDTADAISRLLFQGTSSSPANVVFLDNAIEARRTSLCEMLEMKQLKKGIDVDFYSRTLISLTWGTALFRIKGKFSPGDFRSELIRGSMSLILPWTTNKAHKRTLEIIQLFTNPS